VGRSTGPGPGTPLAGALNTRGRGAMLRIGNSFRGTCRAAGTHAQHAPLSPRVEPVALG